MLKGVNATLTAAVGLAIGLAIWQACPKEKTVRLDPVIVTEWDTMSQLDTVWLERVRREVDTVNLVQRVIVQVPETVFVTDSSPGAYEVGITAIEAPLSWGDTLQVRGFHSVWFERGLVTSWWETRHFVKGPIRSVIVDSVPPLVSFYDIPEPSECNTICKAKLIALSAPVIVLGWEIVKR